MPCNYQHCPLHTALHSPPRETRGFICIQHTHRLIVRRSKSPENLADLAPLTYPFSPGTLDNLEIETPMRRGTCRSRGPPEDPGVNRVVPLCSAGRSPPDDDRLISCTRRALRHNAMQPANTSHHHGAIKATLSSSVQPAHRGLRWWKCIGGHHAGVLYASAWLPTWCFVLFYISVYVGMPA